MSKLSDHDLKQMSEDWQGRQPGPVIRSLLKRTLDELRVARDRLNQNPNNSLALLALGRYGALMGV
jgi:hypothetical protein